MSDIGGPHDDEMIDKTIFPAPYEQMDQSTKRSRETDSCFSEWGQEVFRQKVVFVFKCKRCGRVRKDTETSCS
jgi:hypothetical protein